jgi:hypothetical protein
VHPQPREHLLVLGVLSSIHKRSKNDIWSLSSLESIILDLL